MNQETLSQLEQLVDNLIARNAQLSQEITTLREHNAKLQDENETLQLEVLESEEQQKETSTTLSSLLEKLQAAS
ncbi:cell division protein ZapB [Pseudoalteromonas sp. SSDWG2]|uniref:cell division protein ZapB n=1 Tax=Pseudoalteromonas sp. SSDWG2 TaxID=3139391 RepID=UPI003BAA0A1F